MSSRASIATVLVAAGLVGGCAGGKQVAKPQDILTAEAAYASALERIARHDLRQAREVLQQISFTETDRERLEPLVRLATADATFYQATTLAWIDARSLYVEFVTLYGDHPLAPYAQLQVGSCSLRQVNHPSKDQTQTLRAIADLEEVPRRYPGSAYDFAARSLVADARDHLAESEFLVGKFYLKRKSYTAASRRFRRVLDLYPAFVGLDKTLLYLGRALTLGDEIPEARVCYEQLLTNHPDSRWADRARKRLADLPALDQTASADGRAD